MKTIIKTVRSCDAEPVIINIARTTEENELRSYNYLENIKAYNKILQDLSKELCCRLINIYNIVDTTPSCLLGDGIHLSKEGNRRLAEKIIKHVNELAVSES